MSVQEWVDLYQRFRSRSRVSSGFKTRGDTLASFLSSTNIKKKNVVKEVEYILLS